MAMNIGICDYSMINFLSTLTKMSFLPTRSVSILTNILMIFIIIYNSNEALENFMKNFTNEKMKTAISIATTKRK